MGHYLLGRGGWTSWGVNAEASEKGRAYGARTAPARTASVGTKGRAMESRRFPPQ